jgi:ornithine cyclodeaminase/alanine dehydrogenase-like protein (mu-crystallin family)
MDRSRPWRSLIRCAAFPLANGQYLHGVLTDLTEKCVRVGDLHLAIEGGLMAPEQVRGEPGQVIAGLRPGRTSQEEVLVYDATSIRRNGNTL